MVWISYLSYQGPKAVELIQGYGMCETIDLLLI